MMFVFIFKACMYACVCMYPYLYLYLCMYVCMYVCQYLCLEVVDECFDLQCGRHDHYSELAALLLQLAKKSHQDICLKRSLRRHNEQSVYVCMYLCLHVHLCMYSFCNILLSSSYIYIYVWISSANTTSTQLTS